MPIQRQICRAPIGCIAPAIDAIGIVMALAADVAIALAAVHEQAIFPFQLRHPAARPLMMSSFKRKLVYLGGFDPRGARYYHQLLAEQVAAHNASCASQDRLTLTDRRRAGPNNRWDLADAGGRMHTEFEFLVWDDLVRAHWPNNPLAILAQTFAAYRHTLAHKDPAIEALAPGGSRFTLYAPGISLIALPLLFAAVFWGVAQVWLGGWLALGLAVAGGLGLSLAIFHRMNSLWILRFVIFNDRLARQKVGPAVWERLEAFAQRLSAVLDEDCDEVLFVSHSNGTVLAIPVLAKVLEQRGGALPEHFAMVTLGGCMLFMAGRRDARWFGQALDGLSQAQPFLWLDLASITDGACAAGVDPFSGREHGAPSGLIQLSPRWFTYCDPARYQARRRDKYTTHFDYLRRLDRPSALDYLGLSAAPRPLAASIAAFEAERTNHEFQP